MVNDEKLWFGKKLHRNLKNLQGKLKQESSPFIPVVNV